jgi:hypothetical protein
LQLLLTEWKFSRPEIFRAYVQITPDCFDVLVSVLQDDPVFHSESNVPQMPVAAQVAIALYRFGHYGNAISTKLVALWAGIGYGTVRLITQRVMKAICSGRFRRAALYWPTADEKEEAKTWVEENSCPAWRDGWVMVDGTVAHWFHYMLDLLFMAIPGMIGSLITLLMSRHVYSLMRYVNICKI